MFQYDSEISTGRLSAALFIVTIVATALLPLAALVEHDAGGAAAFEAQAEADAAREAAAWSALPALGNNS